MPEPRPTCLTRGCEEAATHRGRCQPHYARLRRRDPAVRAAERDYKLRKRYGITAEQADALLASANYCCQLCGSPAEEFPRGLCIDHDHVTGSVRGVLCPSCNVGVAHFAEDTGVLQAAIEYLSRAATARLDTYVM